MRICIGKKSVHTNLRPKQFQLVVRMINTLMKIYEIAQYLYEDEDDE